MRENKRYTAEYNLYDGDFEVICEVDEFNKALKSVLKTYKLVKNCRCADFRIKDNHTGVKTHMELGEKGISIFSNLIKKNNDKKGLVYDLKRLKGEKSVER